MYQRIDEADEVIALAGAYFTAMVDGDADGLRQVFHPKASIIGNFGGELEFAGLEGFIETTADAKTGDRPFEYRVDSLVLKGDTAVVSVGGYCYATWFTDHLSMVRIEGAWKIVAKTFYPHPATSETGPADAS